MSAWRHLKIKGRAPSARAGHTTTPMGQNMLVLGGACGDDVLGDAYVLNTAGLMGWSEAKTAGKSPSARRGHSTVPVGEKLFVFGGFGVSEEPLDDLTVLSTTKMVWSRPRVTGETPLPRGGHSSALVGTTIFSFGGKYITGALNDLVALDTAASPLAWRELEQQGDVPSARYDHSCVAVGEQLVLFGGFDGNSPLASLYIFDAATGTWTRHKRADGAPWPPARYQHACAVADGYVYIFGGYGASTDLNDLWRLHVATMQWQALALSGPAPSPRVGATLLCLRGSTLFTFGGAANGAEDAELHALSLEKAAMELKVQAMMEKKRMRIKSKSGHKAHKAHKSGAAEPVAAAAAAESPPVRKGRSRAPSAVDVKVAALSTIQPVPVEQELDPAKLRDLELTLEQRKRLAAESLTRAQMVEHEAAMEVQSLQQRNAEARQLGDHVEELRSEARLLEMRYTQVRESVQAMEADIAAREARLRELDAMAVERRSSAESELAALEARMAEGETAHTAQLAALQATLDAIAGAEAQAQADHEGQRSAMQAKINAAQTEQSAQVQALYGDTNARRAELAALKTERDALQRSAVEAEERALGVQHDVQSERAHREQAEQRVAAAREVVVGKRAKEREVRARVAEVEAAAKAKQMEVARLRAELQVLKESGSALTARVQRQMVEGEVEDARAERKAAEEQLKMYLERCKGKSESIGFIYDVIENFGESIGTMETREEIIDELRDLATLYKNFLLAD